MKKQIAALCLAFAGFSLAGFASANCTGTGSFSTCYDAQSGNSYNVQRFGNQTSVQGFNPRTGSSWSQNSQKIGNTTFHNGRSASGNTWSGTSQRIGNQTLNQGINSQGRPYSGWSYD